MLHAAAANLGSEVTKVDTDEQCRPYPFWCPRRDFDFALSCVTCIFGKHSNNNNSDMTDFKGFIVAEAHTECK